MSGDIVVRLRRTNGYDCCTDIVGTVSLLEQAAIEIERLRVEVNMLRDRDSCRMTDGEVAS